MGDFLHQSHTSIPELEDGCGCLSWYHIGPSQSLHYGGLPCLSMALLQEQTHSNHHWNRLAQEEKLVSQHQRGNPRAKNFS